MRGENVARIRRTHYKLDLSLSHLTQLPECRQGLAFELKSISILVQSVEAYLHVARAHHRYRVELEVEEQGLVVEVGREVKDVERE